MTWTEARIQNLLASDFNRRNCVCVPNCGVFGWEADLVRVTPRLLTAEYEIKISRADFRADTRGGYKRWRQLNLSTPEWLDQPGRCLPNYFWYVAPQGIIPLEDVPAYAGLVEVTDSYQVMKAAPQLHKRPLDARKALFLVRGIGLRYWAQRAAGAATPASDLGDEQGTRDKL